MQNGVTLSTNEKDLEIKYGLVRYGTIDSKPREMAFTSVKYILADLNNIRRYYIRLGFHLEEFSRCEYYHDFGFVTLEEFCEKNFGLDKSAVSRCINVYREFNASNCVTYENGLKQRGAAIELSPEWNEYSYSQLCEILPLTPEQRKDISPDMSVKQIREYKKYLKSKKSDNSVATSQQEKFDYKEWINKKGVVLKNYMKKLIPEKSSVALYIYGRNGKQICVGRLVDILEYNNNRLYIRLWNDDNEIGEAIKNE